MTGPAAGGTFAPGLLAGRRILVTGGGTGLGAAMARRFAGLGARPVLCGRRPDVLADAATRLAAETGAEVATHACDLRDPAAVAAMVDRIWDAGPLDVLVNNAAANFIARTERLSARAADAILNTSLHGALYCTLEVGRRWIDGRRGGVILSILSTSTLTGRAFTVPSAMAKSGLLAMTRSLAVEWGPKGIRTVAIAPGPFPTPGASARLNPDGRKADEAAFNPLGRVGAHDELADLAAFLVSDRAGYVNGEMVTLDGGQHLRTSGAEDLLAWTDADWERLRRG
jgi:NAD(P)-dependent dehydrogenase (short-subunit alcohol dehydrogenase family)